MSQSHPNPPLEYSLSFMHLIIFIFSSEKIYHDFATFGEIGDFYRPKLLDHHIPSRFLFIRYYRSDSGYRAMMEMHGKVYGDRIITVHDANDQDSFFTQDTGEYLSTTTSTNVTTTFTATSSTITFITSTYTTTIVSISHFIPLTFVKGYITNEKFDSPEKKAKEFDASLPYNHYELKHKQELSLQVDHVITLRVDEISTQIRCGACVSSSMILMMMIDIVYCSIIIYVILCYTSKEQLESIFSEFGEVCSIYYPIDLKTRTHRGFAFIRYSHEGR